MFFYVPPLIPEDADLGSAEKGLLLLLLLLVVGVLLLPAVLLLLSARHEGLVEAADGVPGAGSTRAELIFWPPDSHFDSRADREVLPLLFMVLEKAGAPGRPGAPSCLCSDSCQVKETASVQTPCVAPRTMTRRW